jgi:hypothetical protein
MNEKIKNNNYVWIYLSKLNPIYRYINIPVLIYEI